MLGKIKTGIAIALLAESATPGHTSYTGRVSASLDVRIAPNWSTAAGAVEGILERERMRR